MHTSSSWKDYFVFSKKERKVVIGLIVFLIGYALLLFFYEPKKERLAIENLNDAVAKMTSESIDSIALQSHFTAKPKVSLSPTSSENPLFSFDPNVLDEEGWKKLGLRDKTVHTIINYRNKGGRFYKPDDLKKIYGLTAAEADKLMPFVTLNSVQNQTHSFALNNGENKPLIAKQKPALIDVNTATIEQWKALPLIGDVLS
ncbi:MAG: helix-hairpin-helix domain-containing protein, partial [Bacteroidota bacterium]|nr:helix-hairpin-helix domain-containing protein [Bacteroidota bacterium]